MIKEMKSFRMVVTKGGFRAAAMELNISPSLVTKHINALEQKLNTALLKRNSRNITMTTEGKVFYDNVINLLKDYDLCMHQQMSVLSDINGKLKVGVPHSINNLHLLPRLNKFIEKHPNINLELISGNHSLELFSHGYDLAFHCGNLPDSNLYFTKLGYWRKKTCLTRKYMEKYGTPKIPADLENHNCIVHFANRTATWKYVVNKLEVDVAVRGNTTINNSLDILKFTSENLGICYLPDFTVSQELERGELITVLDEFMPPPLPIYLVHINRNLSPKEKAFVEFIKSLKICSC
ncbi:LysR family transcriptional regulator [Vibrio artabrorum]|uniref:LysR family transcriptional regulator n=1 Tax=Vibrio artabrorum TaxID=446374 RepID=A0ABT8CLV2_9VIBR|nr:LysR family transcriptional regulator [Vibrio artabrorum]MDN3702662.1 LysR family transcriptional regulator [Vibrio artabrorum]